MKLDKFFTTLAAVSLTTPCLANTEIGEPDLDFASINANISAAIAPMVAKSSDIDSFSYQFDASETDIAQDRYAVHMALSGSAPWSKSGFDASGLFIFDHDAKGGAVNKLSLDAKVETDVLGMFRHIAANYKGCPVADQVTGVLRVAMMQDCKIMPRLAQVTTMEQLFLLFEESLYINEMAFKDYSTALRVAINATTDSELRHLLKKQLASSDSILTSIQNAVLEKTDDGLRFTAENMSIVGLFAIDSIDMELSKDVMKVKGHATTKLGSKLYTLIKPELLQILKDLEQGEEYTTRFIQLETSFWLRLVEAKLAMGSSAS